MGGFVVSLLLTPYLAYPAWLGVRRLIAVVERTRRNRRIRQVLAANRGRFADIGAAPSTERRAA